MSKEERPKRSKRLPRKTGKLAYNIFEYDSGPVDHLRYLTRAYLQLLPDKRKALQV